MADDRLSQTVSQHHAKRATIPQSPTLTGSSGVRPVTNKKQQLDNALTEFAAAEQKRTQPEKSLLADDNELSEEDGAQGTIITNTKRHRWSFTDAVSNALGGWMKQKRKKISHNLAKPEQQQPESSAKDRAHIIEQASTQSALAKNVPLEKKEIPPPAQHTPKIKSSIRIKTKDVQKEIGETKPRWTHIIEDEPEQAHEVVEEAAPEPTKRSYKKLFLAAPKKKKFLPGNVTPQTPKNIQKVYRTVSTPQPVVVSNTPKPKVVDTQKAEPIDTPSAPPVAEEKTEAPTSSMQDEKLFAKTSAPKPTPTPLEKKVIEQTNEDNFQEVASFEEEARTDTTPQTRDSTPNALSQLIGMIGATSNMTLILAIVCLVVVVLGNTFLRTDPSAVSEVTENLNVSLVVPDSTQTVDYNTDNIHDAIDDALLRSSGVVEFVSESKTNLALVSEWSAFFNLNATAAQLGGVSGEPYVVVQTNSYDLARASMLTFERQIPPDIASLFSVESPLTFRDGVIDRANIRIGSIGLNTKLVYYIREDGRIVITSSESLMSLLIPRLK